MNALQIRGLAKTYDSGMVALKGIDLTVQEGDFLALLGPNGAGKSTPIGIICSLLNKSDGAIEIFDHDLDRERETCKSHIGLVPQEINFNVFETPRNILITQAGYYGIPRREAAGRADEYLASLDLYDKRNQIARTLSGGMKRRLMVARALVHQPRLLILDEPTAGVDIEIRRSMWKFLSDLNAAGTTIILTTHYLEEAESLCRNVAIIDGGEIVESGAVDELLSRAMVQSFVLDLEQAPATGIQLQGYRLIEQKARQLEVEVSIGTSMNDLFAQLAAQDINVVSMRNKANRLEEFFLRLVSDNKKDNAA